MNEEPYTVVQVADFVNALLALKETQDALAETIERLIELEEAVYGKTELR